MYIPKRYGESKVDKCPFCGSQAITLNTQKIPVCLAHKSAVLDDMKCVCGQYLETKIGKFGVYFSCIRCGNLNLRKVLEINTPKDKSASAIKSQGPDKSVPNCSQSQKNHPFSSSPSNQKDTQGPKEIIIRSDDPRYFD
jgi:hypothetical protein